MSTEVRRVSAALELSTLAHSISEIHSARWRLYAALAVERCARELALVSPAIGAIIDRARAQLQLNTDVTSLVERFRASSVSGWFATDVAGFLSLVAASFRSQHDAVLDAIEALLGCGRADLALVARHCVEGMHRVIAEEMIEDGVRRCQRRGGRARFVHCLDLPLEERRASLALAVACTRRSLSSGSDALAAIARRACARISRARSRGSAYAIAYVAALDYAASGIEFALQRARGGRHRAARDWARLAVLDAALLADRERDAAAAMALISGSITGQRAAIALAHWWLRQGRGRTARRVIASSRLSVAHKTAMLAALRHGRLPTIELHEPRCDCAGCWLPRLGPVAPPAPRSRCEERARVIAQRSIDVVTSGAPELEGDCARWLAAGLAGRQPPDGDATHWARAYYDEGVSLSPRAHSRRQALVRAARHVLAVDFGDEREIDPGVVASRLRLLRNLGGERAARSIVAVLAGRRFAGASPPFWPQTFALLCDVSPSSAVLLALTRYAELPAPVDVITILAARRCITAAFADGWRALEKERRGWCGAHEARCWMQTLVNVWLEKKGRLPDRVVLAAWRGHGASTRASVPESIASAEHRLRAVLRLPPLAFATALLADSELRGWLGAIHGPLLGAGGKPWTDNQLVMALTEAVAGSRGVPDNGAIGRLTRCLPFERSRRAQLASRMVLGRAPVDAAAGGPLGDTGARMRYLDKRVDILDYLRFADSVWCCFNSRSPWYEHNSGWIADAWRDPLSFCFQIERLHAGVRTPIGFVLGGFALLGRRRAAVVLNGVYLSRQRPRLRAEVLRFIEERLCAPMGISELGLANRHAGGGRLPASYRDEHRRIERLRALSRTGSPVGTTSDDISSVVNQAIDVRLSWRQRV